MFYMLQCLLRTGKYLISVINARHIKKKNLVIQFMEVENLVSITITVGFKGIEKINSRQHQTQKRIPERILKITRKTSELAS